MTQWIKSQIPTKDVMSTKWGHGVVIGRESENAIRVQFDMGRTCIMSFAHYHGKGELDYVAVQPRSAVIEYRDNDYDYGRLDQYLYHLTDLNNMESIITHGLMSRAQLQNSDAGFVDVADRSIISKRGNLEYYIPFHFVPNTAFDYVVKHNHRDKQFVYICISKSYARSRDSYILLSHPTSNYAQAPRTFDDGIRNLDWDSIEDPYAYMDPVRKQKKMAECITAEPVTADHFAVIVVSSETAAKHIYNLYVKHGVSCENTRFVIDYSILAS